TFTHILREVGTMQIRDRLTRDAAGQDRLNEAILDLVDEGKTVVLFQCGDLQQVCVGQAWYSLCLNPVGKGYLPQAAASDLRYSRVFCGDVEELIAAVTDLLAGKEVVVPHMVGSNRMLNDRTAPVRRRRADRADLMDGFEYLSPFVGESPWSTHRGNPQRTGADDGPGPTKPNVLWVHKTEDHFIAPLVP